MIEKAYEISLGDCDYFVRFDVLFIGENGFCKECGKPAKAKQIVVSELQECGISLDLKSKKKIINIIKRFFGESEMKCEDCTESDLEHIAGFLAPNYEDEDE